MLQNDPTAAVAPSACLVAWSRLGSSQYQPSDLESALEAQTLVELRGMIRPMEDMVLYRADMATWSDGGQAGWHAWQRDWVRANEGCRRDILERLRGDGPLPQRDLPDTC